MASPELFVITEFDCIYKRKKYMYWKNCKFTFLMSETGNEVADDNVSFFFKPEQHRVVPRNF